MATPIFPVLYGFNIKKKPTFASIVQAGKSGREIGTAQQPIPIWEFELTAEVLQEETQNTIPFAYFSGQKQFQELSQLFLACSAQYGEFFFDDWSDNSRQNQSLGTADDVKTDFVFLRTITSGSVTYTEPVGGVNLEYPLTVYVNGVEVLPGGNWAVSTDLTKIIFVVPPEFGFVVTATFHYYYLCRFITDELGFEEFLYNRWNAKAIRFRSIIPYRLVSPGSLIYEEVWIPLGPVEYPDPPVDESPAVDGVGWGRVGILEVDPTVVVVDLFPISTTQTNDVLFVFVINEKDSLDTPQVVASMTSSSGLTFTRRGGGFINITDQGDQALNNECWTAPTLSILNDEIITVVFSEATGCAIVGVVAVRGARIGSPLDMGVVPVAFSGVDAPSGPTVTISTTNNYDLLLWATGGMTSAANSGAPTGFTSVGLVGMTCSSFHDGRILYYSIFYKTLSATVTSEVIAPSSQPPLSPTRGVGILAAIRN